MTAGRQFGHDRTPALRRHLCARCNTLVDVTGLVRADTIRDDSRTYVCRVATACRVRAARRERTAGAIVGVSGTERRVCRFCRTERLPEHLRWEAFALFECRAVGSCERRMSRGDKT